MDTLGNCKCCKIVDIILGKPSGGGPDVDCVDPGDGDGKSANGRFELVAAATDEPASRPNFERQIDRYARSRLVEPSPLGADAAGQHQCRPLKTSGLADSDRW